MPRATATTRSDEGAPTGGDDQSAARTLPFTQRHIPWFEIVLTALGVSCMAATIITFAQSSGLLSTAQLSLVALIPLAIVIATLVFLDRREPEPLWMRLVVLVWGAGVATLVASAINSAGLADVTQVIGDYDGAVEIAAVFIAPVAEETLKGMGVVLVVLWRRHHINSVLDGVIYAGYAGAGFAFVENIQYFIQASAQGDVVLGSTVLFRGLFSPFVHPMATSFIGGALAFAIVRTRRRWSWAWIGPIGWVAAVGVHALWNFLAVEMGESWLLAYVTIQVPLFAVWIVVLLVMSNRESRTIARGLVPYVRTGWILPEEVRLVTDDSVGAAGRKWARRQGGDAPRAMRSFKRSAAALGLDQVIMSRIGPQEERVRHSRENLARLTVARETLTAASARSEWDRR